MKKFMNTTKSFRFTFKNLFLSALVFGLLSPAPAFSQLALGGDKGNKQPVEIEADNAIEWLRDEKQYIARGNAVAVQGEYSVKADRLIADYKDAEGGRTEVWQFTADGNVIIATNTYKATGDKAVYNLLEDTTILTGTTPKIESKDSTLTATDSIRFFAKENKAVAIGKPIATRGDRTIRADTMTGFFKKDKNNNLALNRVVATGNIKIVTPNEVLFGDKAVYEMAAGKATVTGNVRITRGESQLNGSKAVFDIEKGISTLYGGNEAQNGETSPSQRVRGLFFLGSSENIQKTNNKGNDKENNKDE